MNLSQGSAVRVRTGAPFAGMVGTVAGSPVHYGTAQTVLVRLQGVNGGKSVPFALGELRVLATR